MAWMDIVTDNLLLARSSLPSTAVECIHWYKGWQVGGTALWLFIPDNGMWLFMPLFTWLHKQYKVAETGGKVCHLWLDLLSMCF